AARNEAGNVFDYLGYVPRGGIVKLEPPPPDGKLTVLTADPIWSNKDGIAFDLSVDPPSILFSPPLPNDPHFQPFSMYLDGTNVKQLTEGAVDYVYPIYMPGQRILYMTNKVVEVGAKQFRDEYERATTSQVGIINIDGTGEALGPRNVSHRV